MRSESLPALRLPRGHFVRTEAAPGRRLECLRGSVWLTFDRDRRDIVVSAGGGFTFDSSERGLLYAFADSEIVLLEGARA